MPLLNILKNEEMVRELCIDRKCSEMDLYELLKMYRQIKDIDFKKENVENIFSFLKKHNIYYPYSYQSKERAIEIIKKYYKVSNIEIVNILSKVCQKKGYVFEKILGQGSYGVVRIACKSPRGDPLRGCPFVAKIQRNDKYAKKEIQIYKIFKKDGITPVLYDNWTCTVNKKSYSVMIIERMDMDFHHYLKNTPKGVFNDLEKVLLRIYDMLEVMQKKNTLHLDLNFDNILLKGKGNNIRFYLSDFGLSKKFLKKDTKPLPLSKRFHYDIFKYPPSPLKNFDFICFSLFFYENFLKDQDRDLLKKIFNFIEKSKKLQKGYITKQIFEYVEMGYINPSVVGGNF